MRCIGSIEERFAETVRDAGSGEALVQKHRAIRHGVVQFLHGRMPMLRPLIRMPSSHRRDPLSCRNILAPRSERFLNLSNRCRVLENRVVPGTIREADAVDMGFDQTRHNSPAAEIDDASVGAGCRSRIADCHKPAVADRHRSHDRIGSIHRSGFDR